ncbi:MAG TPA: hypothetical protein VFE42_04700 [Chloroflexota bacterium]|nr:hypothetical protein [Chloroflexota bacterium]
MRRSSQTYTRRIALLTGVILAVAFGLRNHAAPPRVYTVAQVASGIAAQPRAWIGRTVAVRGIAHGFRRHPCLPSSSCQVLFYLFDARTSSTLTVLEDAHPTSQLAALHTWPVVGVLFPQPQPIEPAFYRTATYRVLLQTMPCGDQSCVVADLGASG